MSLQIKACQLWFHKVCSNIVLQRKHNKLQFLQEQNPIWRQSEHMKVLYIRNKQQKYLKGKTAKFATKGKNKITRDLYRSSNEN